MKLKIYKWNNHDISAVHINKNEYCLHDDLYVDYECKPITGIGQSIIQKNTYLLYINGAYITESSKPLEIVMIEFNKIIKQKVFE